jgi:hypothetical protein
MADQGIKKVTIPRSSLPPSGKNGEYLVRYRIVSQDKNRYSHWSPIYKVTRKSLPDNFIAEDNGILEKVGSIVMVAWNIIEDISSYDIFVKYDTDFDYSYHGSSITNSYSIIKKSNTNSISVKVQLGGISKEISTTNTIYTGSISLV